MASTSRSGGATYRNRGAALRDPNVELVNANRPPSEAVAQYATCGAAKTKDGVKTGEKCTQKAGFNTDHVGYGNCRLHGGMTAAGKKHGARLMGREVLKATKFGGDLTITNVTAEQALIEEVRRSTAMVRWLEERIGTWQPESAQSDLGNLPRLGTQTSSGRPTITEEHAWLVIYREERSHAAKVAKMCIDAGIAERMVTIAEDQGALLASAIKAVLDALHLNPRQAAQVPEIVPRILRQISAPPVAS